MEELIRMLRSEGCSLVVSNGGTVRTFWGRGVSDLHRLWREEPEFLQVASLADKVVGKGAAALMIAGGVKEVFAGVVSEPALGLFRQSAVKVSYDVKTAGINNRSNTGRCPLETLCGPCATVEDCLPLIDRFVQGLRQQDGRFEG